MAPLSEKAQRALQGLDYHVRENLWAVQIATSHATDANKPWRIAGAECLADTLDFDVRGATIEEALEAAFDSFSTDFIREAESGG